jgi:hypothetical protein
VDASRDAKPTAETKSEIVGRLRSIAKIVIIDIAAPLIAYSLLRSAGMSTVTALVLSGVFPALGVAIGVIQHRRLDVVGALVLAGIVKRSPYARSRFTFSAQFVSSHSPHLACMQSCHTDGEMITQCHRSLSSPCTTPHPLRRVALSA